MTDQECADVLDSMLPRSHADSLRPLQRRPDQEEALDRAAGLLRWNSVAIAEAINESRQPANGFLRAEHWNSVVRCVALSIADSLGVDDRGFDRGKFLKGCGVEK